MTRSLDEIEVTYDPEEDRYDDHAEITVKWAAAYVLDEVHPYGGPPEGADAAAFGDPTKAQHVESSLFVAGLLGRLAWRAYPWIAWTRQQHRCRQIRWLPPGARPSHEGPSQRLDGCHLADSGLFDPQDRLSDGLELWFYVPAEEVEQWLARIDGWLRILTGPAAT